MLRVESSLGSPGRTKPSWAARAKKQGLAGLGPPPAKRARTGSSSSIDRTVDPVDPRESDPRHKKAQQWLENPNMEKTASRDIAFVNDEPPVPQHGSDDGGSVVPVYGSDISTTQNQPATIGPTAPTASLLAQYNASTQKFDRDDSEDFRSVIDDLTIQNKKLKSKLQKYERLHCSHLQKEKLFEVRIHGLPAHKQKELEDTLRSFASSIDNGSQPEASKARSKRGHGPAPTALHKTSSTSTSDSRPVDSAYASMSSLQNSLPNTAPVTQQPPLSKASQNNVRSFLDDIPETLRPSKVLAMSDKTKGKLVVRRLEQIFTGRGSAPHQHVQSQQQQDVSTAAAEAERSKIEACGQRVWREGTREAHILPAHADLRVDPTENTTSKKSANSTDGTDSVPPSAGISRSDSPEQRPTRPLDLDIYRAQVPSDNMDYIRHLNVNNEEESLPTKDSWVYLNLLTSMAQLHTLNVTPEFVRNAIKGRSQKFQLSDDGSKVRWRGGLEGSRLSSNDEDNDGTWRSSDGSPMDSQRSSIDSGQDQAGLLGQEQSSAKAGAKRRLINLENAHASDRFHYKPMFVRANRSEDDDSISITSDSVQSTDSMEYETGINSSSNAIHERKGRLRGRRKDTGPIIFYHRAKFCTDLGGDRNCTSEGVSYNRLIQTPIGCIPEASDDGNLDTEDTGNRRSFLQFPRTESPEEPLKRSPLDLDELKTSISDCTSTNVHTNPMDMEVSGLGGIQPMDNFVVKVQTKRERRKAKSNKQSLQSRGRRPTMISRILKHTPLAGNDSSPAKSVTSSPASMPVNAEIISMQKTSLPPSTLPPPSYFIQSSSESSDTSETTSTSDSDNAINPLITGRPRTEAITPRPMLSSHHRSALGSRFGLNAESSADTEAKESSYDVDSNDESEIDLLAHAREADPEAVRALEGQGIGMEDDRSLSQEATGGESGDEQEDMSMDEEDVDDDDEED